MYLKKKKNISNNSRHQFLPDYFSFGINTLNFFFKKKKKVFFGKTKKGQKNMFTKKKFLFNQFNLNDVLPWSIQSALVINFKHIMLRGLFFILKFSNGSISFKKSIFGVNLGDFINCIFFLFKKYNFFYLGWQCLLLFVPRFVFISNILVLRFKPLKFNTASGCYAQVLEVFKEWNLIQIRFSSGKKKFISWTSICTLGRNNNIFKKYLIYGSYKWSHYLGRSPIVRGVAMNPVDHPHGGRTKTNKPEVSPWNWTTKHSH